MFDFFKKKSNPKDLEKVRELGLISEQEFLELKKMRAEKELKDFLNKKTKKK